GGPHAQREGALAGVGEQVADHRHGGGHDERAAHAQQGAQRDQADGRVGDQDQQRDRAEDEVADDEHATAAEAVGQTGGGDQQSGHGQAVDVDHPQQFHRGGVEGGRDLRQRHVEDRQVHDDDQQAGAQDGQS